MHEIKPIKVEKSVIDQLVELPTESVVLIKSAGGFENPTSTVLHRTGITGWLLTRDSLPGYSGKYLNVDSVRTLVERHEEAGSTFHVIYSPRWKQDEEE